MVRLRPLIRDVAATLLYAAGLTRPARAAAGRLMIVTFHRVLPPEQLAQYPSPGIAVTPDELSWFLGFFREHFSCRTLRETMDRGLGADANGGADRPLLAVTFDDGQRDNYEHARPVLAAHGVRASFYVVAGAVEDGQPLWHDRMGYALRAALGRAPREAQVMLRELGVAGGGGDPHLVVADALERLKALDAGGMKGWLERAETIAGAATVPEWDGMMNWQQLRQLAAEGHEIGSHSLSHPILPHCTDAQLVEEIARSRELLAAGLGGAPVDTFCYPNGDHDDRVVAAVERAGYRYAVTTRWGRNDRSTSRYRLRRCDIQGATARSSAGALSRARLAWRLSGMHPGLG